MQIVAWIIIGLIGGLIGGMGMGGGTLLIPLLVEFGNVSQHAAQCLNLVAFVPMAIVALIIHFRNKLVSIKYALIITIPAIVSAILTSMLATTLKGSILSKSFGVFLVLLGIYQLWVMIFRHKKKSTNA